MPWTYRDPMVFPRSFHDGIFAPIAQLGTPVLFHIADSESELTSVLERFRWFRWCVKQQPSLTPELFQAISAHSFRASTSAQLSKLLIYITAQPNKVSDFIELNPDLANEILPQCQ
jgi:hypothetical protein